MYQTSHFETNVTYNSCIMLRQRHVVELKTCRNGISKHSWWFLCWYSYYSNLKLIYYTCKHSIHEYIKTVKNPHPCQFFRVRHRGRPYNFFKVFKKKTKNLRTYSYFTFCTPIPNICLQRVYFCCYDHVWGKYSLFFLFYFSSFLSLVFHLNFFNNLWCIM